MDIATRFVAASRGGDRVGSRGSRQEVAPEQGLLVPDFLQKDEINREATTVFNLFLSRFISFLPTLRND